MIKIYVFNSLEMKNLARNLSKQSSAGTVYGFIGNFGVGKTFFIKNMFSINLNLISDSFIYLKKYSLKNNSFYHLDLSKIASYSDFFLFYSNFMLTSKDILCIEWIDKFYDCFTMFKKIILIEILFLDKDSRIVIIYTNNNFLRKSLANIKSGMEQSGSLSGS